MIKTYNFPYSIRMVQNRFLALEIPYDYVFLNVIIINKQGTFFFVSFFLIECYFSDYEKEDDKNRG